MNPVSVFAFASKEDADRHALLVCGLIIFVVLPIRADDSAVVPSALEANPEGWIDIMPPADLKGWSRVPVPPGGKLGRAQWHVDADRGLLVCDGDGGHDMLLTETEYGDAIFHFEFCYTKAEGKTGYNSGVYVRNSKDGAVWHQAQFGDALGGFLFGVTPTTEGESEFFTLQGKVKDGRVKPAGQWNTMEVTARGKTLTLWVNGAVTCEFENCGITRGHVGLEGDGYRVEFRNLKVKELPERAEEEVAGDSPMTGDKPDRKGQESWRVFVGQWNIGAPDPPGGQPS